MKIAKLELFKVPPRWLFLKMTTDDGLVGWGEPVCEGKADSVAAAVKELGAQLMTGHRLDPELFASGFQLLLWGYFKKMVIADRLAATTNALPTRITGCW